jgi:hypothetical protein
MSTLAKKDFPLGWIPCDDEINGRKAGLLRADNLVQDEIGIWRLMKGTKKISSGAFSSYVNEIYSRYLNGKKLRYVSVNGGVFRNYGGAGTLADFDSGTIASGGDTTYATFGTGFGHNFIISGTKKKKDNGVNTDNTAAGNPSFDLGIPAPSAPSLAAAAPYSLDVSEKHTGNFDYWERMEPVGAETYNDASDYVEIQSSPTTFRAIALVGITHAVTMDAKTLTGGYKGYDSDVFKINVRIGDTATFTGVRVEYLLDTPTAAGYGEDIKDFYYKDWTFRLNRSIEGTKFDPSSADRTPTDITPDELSRVDRVFGAAERFHGLVFNQEYRQGINVWTTLTCQRGEFTRVGTDDAKHWGVIKGIRVIFTGIEQQTYVFNDLTFEGGPLTGLFTYKQISVYNNGDYQEFSVPSADTAELQIINAGVTVTYNYTVAAGNQINRIWIYRRSQFTGGFYKVKEVTSPTAGGSFLDIMSDAEALQWNDQLPAYATVLPDYIYGMICDYFGRNLYMTAREIVPSYKDNPGVYDSRFVVDIGGDEGEFNLFIAKVSNSSILLGTTKDIYEVTGDGSEIELMDGSIVLDFKIRALGVAAPPVSDAFCVYDSTLIYLAHDGWHRMVGSSNDVFSQELSLLYQKETRHGINHVLVPIANSSVVMCLISKNKFWACVDHDTIGRALHVFNFKTKTWEFKRFGAYGQNPLAIFAEEDGSILYSTTSAGDKFLREYDVGTLFDEATNLDFLYRTIYDDDNKPRNRKDLYTLRADIDSGNTAISLIIRAKDDAATIYTQTYSQAFNGNVVITLNINQYISTPVKKIQVEISGACPTLEIRSLSIDYDERPEQLDFLIIRPSNFGVAGRKRVPIIPMLIDTIGANVTFTPVIDAVNKTTSTINTNTKAPHIHYFNSSETGYMVGGVLSGNKFEFYEMITPREIEVLPDPIKYKHTNYSNLGTTSRKRIIQYARMIDTKSSDVSMTPIVDGVLFTPQIINSALKKTHIYSFATDVKGVDIGCILSGANEFEDYGESLADCLIEKLPAQTKYKFTNYSNLGSASRKKIVQYARVVDTLGHDVSMIPVIDGTSYPAKTINCNRKQTHIYTFTGDVTAVDIACILSGNYEFEDYGENLEECIWEKLPRVTKYIDLNTTNWGIANKKRVRTIPFVINTRGGSVTYIPRVDGVTYPQSNLFSVEKRTLLHHFSTDSFGIDYGGILVSQNEFEFYEMLKPEIVQILPVSKTYDQLGPIDFNKIGKIKELRLRLVPTGSTISYQLISADSVIQSANFTVTPNIENVYNLKFPRGINPTICRVTLLSSNPFHRLSAEFKVHLEGKSPEYRYITENGEEV